MVKVAWLVGMVRLDKVVWFLGMVGLVVMVVMVILVRVVWVKQGIYIYAWTDVMICNGLPFIQISGVERREP